MSSPSDTEVVEATDPDRWGREIVEELRKSRTPGWKFWLSLGVTFALGVAAVLATLAVRDEVRDLSDVPAQELIDGLRLGQTQAETAGALGSPSYLTTPAAELGELLGEEYRRALFYLQDHELAVVGYYDEGGRMRLASVTALEADVRVSFPSGVGGGFTSWFVEHGGEYRSYPFETNKTSIRDLGGGTWSSGGPGASWGYYAIGIGPSGVSNNWANIVAANFYGPFESDLFFGADGAFTEVPSGNFKFNTLVFMDQDLGMDLAWSDDTDRFGLLVEVQFGPLKGELPRFTR